MKSYFRNVSYLISIVLLLQTFTFFTFFFNNPLSNGVNTVTITQLISEIAWVFLVILPPLLLSLKRWNTFNQAGFFVSIIFWPATLIALRIFLAIQYGDPYVAYLLTYPLFIFSDIIVPVIYVYFWVKLNKQERELEEQPFLNQY